MKAFVYLTLGLCVFISCGQVENVKLQRKNTQIITNNALSENVIVLKSANTLCEDRPLIDTIFEVNRLIYGEEKAIELNIMSITNDNYYLVDRERDIFNEHYQGGREVFEVDRIYFDNESNSSSKRDFIDVKRSVSTKRGEKNKICPSVKSYPRESFENAGIILSHAISKSHKAYLEAADSRYHSIAPITLRLTPYIEYQYTHKNSLGEVLSIESRFRADNAFYNPVQKEIVFLPESLELRNSKVFGKPFWEVPMVASHEYGHHIFMSLYKNYKSDGVSAHSQSLHPGCFGERLKLPKQELIKNELNLSENSQLNSSKSKSSLSQKGQLRTSVDSRRAKAYFDKADEVRKRVVTRDFIYNSINEGFADLIAQYSLSKRENTISDMPCFAGSRVVSDSKFPDGTIKYFNSSNIEVILSQTQTNIKYCNMANLQSIHHVGAIFAHVAHILFSAPFIEGSVSEIQEIVSSSRYKDNKSKEKLSMLIKWPILMNRDESANSLSAKQYLEKGLEVLISIIERSYPDSSQKLRKMAGELLSGLDLDL